MTRLKICGISEIDQALAAARWGADYLGLVFAPSRRRISKEKAVQIIKSLASLKTRPAVAGVFVNLPAGEVNAISKECNLDYVQLSGEESLEYCSEILLPVIKTIHISTGTTPQEINETITQGLKIRSDKLTFLLDTGIKNSYGGTGQSFDWRLAREVASHNQVIIAGGLDLVNVGRLLEEVNPWGVDVSSGVETDGKKDLDKIKEFIQKVKSFNGGK